MASSTLPCHMIYGIHMSFHWGKRHLFYNIMRFIIYFNLILTRSTYICIYISILLSISTLIDFYFFFDLLSIIHTDHAIIIVFISLAQIWFVLFYLYYFLLIYSLSKVFYILSSFLRFLLPFLFCFLYFIPYLHYVEVVITILALSICGMCIPHGSVSNRTRIRVRLQTPVPARPTPRSGAILLIAQIALFVWAREKRLDAIHCCSCCSCCLFALFWILSAYREGASRNVEPPNKERTDNAKNISEMICFAWIGNFSGLVRVVKP